MITNTLSDFDKLLVLRCFPGLEDLDLENVSVLAGIAQEHSVVRGTQLTCAGEPLRSLYFVVRGLIRASRAGTKPIHVGERQIFGALEAITHDPGGVDAVAASDAVALELAAEDLLELLEDHFNMLMSTLRRLSSALIDILAQLPQSAWPAGSGLDGGASAVVPDELGFVDRLYYLRESSLFAGAQLQALAELSRVATEVRFDAGEKLWGHGQAATASLFVIEGTIRGLCPNRAAPLVFGPGTELGTLAALAGRERWYTASAVVKGRALRLPTPALIDVLEDQSDFALDIVKSTAGRVLELTDTNEVSFDSPHNAPLPSLMGFSRPHVSVDAATER